MKTLAKKLTHSFCIFLLLQPQDISSFAPKTNPVAVADRKSNNHGAVGVSSSPFRYGGKALDATPTITGNNPTNLPDFRTVTTVPSTLPLSPLTFAGKVECALLQKYRPEEIQRVLESWRLLEQGYEHHEYFGPSDSTTNNNITPETSNCYQYAHSYVRGLTVQQFWPVENISWANKLMKNYSQIRREFQQVTNDMDELIKKGNNIWAGAVTQEAGQYGDGWKTLVLKDRGMWDEVNCNLFPKTAKAIEQSGIPATEVFFASMKPHSEIKLHSDFTNFVLTSHLAIEIPENGNNKCRLTVGDETREWRNGEVMLFDTSLMHDAVNESDGMRYILMFRVWHPDLTEVEREALQFIYDCLSVPEMLDENEQFRMNAERQVQKLRQFPKIKSTSVGFGKNSSSDNSSKNKKKKGKQ
mmetsp:Transcript_17327/g.32823  ORF Transcript_17327/g.32823 Transcript_17327/m.32823 type:complete len:413 (+) Transcript_17327:128-1366(+)